MSNMFDMELKIRLEGLVWQSDWDGEEVGFPEIGVIGYYTSPMEDYTLTLYIDMSDMRIVDLWVNHDDDL